MKVCGVVSEFNPFHNGHKYLLSKIREFGYDAIVCVMSGNFVQRGEYAAFDKKERAKIAAQNGADLVLSLPFPWSSASAEHFAYGAISIIHGIGCVDAVAFGSESGEIRLLEECADFLSNISFDEIKAFQKNNQRLSYAQARESLVLERLGNEYSKLLSSPNDILAIEYLRTLKRLKSNITPFAIKRIDSAHDGTRKSNNISSSSFIRSLSEKGEYKSACCYIPQSNVDFLKNEFRKIDDASYFNLLCGAVLSGEPCELSDIAEIGGGFEYALYREFLLAKNYPQLFDALCSRHLTDAKIRRSLLFAALGVKKNVFLKAPGFSEVLAYSEAGKQILSKIRKTSDICILSKTGNIKNAPEYVKEQFKLQRKSEMIFEKLIKL